MFLGLKYYNSREEQLASPIPVPTYMPLILYHARKTACDPADQLSLDFTIITNESKVD